MVRFALAALCALPGTMAAQQTASTAAGVVAPAEEALEPFARPDGARFQAGAWTYRLSRHRDASVVPLGTRTVEVLETELAGTPAWLIAERREGTAVPTSDSLWLGRSDLAPLRWTAWIGNSQLAASFAGDSVYGALQDYRGRTSFAGALLPGALITPGMLERTVELLPLSPGYAAGASLFLLDVSSPRALPAEISVVGDGRVSVGGRDDDCWVVQLRAGALEERLWVSKGAHRVVRTEDGNGVVGEIGGR